MKWDKYTIKTNAAAIDFVSGILMEIGITNIEIEDNIQLTPKEQKEIYAGILPVLPDDDTAYVHFYVDVTEGEKNPSLLNDGIQIEANPLVLSQQEILSYINDKIDVTRGFPDIGDFQISRDTTQEEDWINNWKEHFKPFRVDDILIKPTWEKMKPATEDKIVIEIDPGTAFGTGMHETTQLCLRELRKHVNPESKVLDLGCGSGILFIAALKSGVKNIKAADIDPIAVKAARENAAVNGYLPERFQVYEGNLLTDLNLQKLIGEESYNIIAANILADVIILFLPVIGRYLAPDGLFITSGILQTKEKQVLDTAAQTADLETVNISRQGGWTGITFKKKQR